ncbi:MAG TPA: hypothetical protein PK920_00650 [Phycisphaerae bacterium]|nr:hypothetical protein [Phycisphaerae bacterium]HRS27132.1 hypothetical protein [Phycisphaerae bacterium]HRT40642.1 hypothetical protein [Phycisphaerae bacterium]
MKRILACNVPWVILLCACNSPSLRLNAPPHGCAEARHEMQAMYTHMSDNALLADMNLSDVDFIPHRPMLSARGEERLCRIVALMQEYGGEIRYTAENGDRDLVDRRIEVIIDFLTEAGLPAHAVREGLPGGRGMEAREVLLIKLVEGTYSPERSGGGEKSGPGQYEK